MADNWIGSRTLDVETTDGKVYRARTIFADAVAYEATARKHGWGTPRDSTMQSLAFVCWHALKRTGDVNGATYEQFRDTIVRVRDIDADDADPDTGPTRPGPSPG